jgi:hypothetical protein
VGDLVPLLPIGNRKLYVPISLGGTIFGDKYYNWGEVIYPPKGIWDPSEPDPTYLTLDRDWMAHSTWYAADNEWTCSGGVFHYVYAGDDVAGQTTADKADLIYVWVPPPQTQITFKYRLNMAGGAGPGVSGQVIYLYHHGGAGGWNALDRPPTSLINDNAWHTATKALHTHGGPGYVDFWYLQLKLFFYSPPIPSVEISMKDFTFS